MKKNRRKRPACDADFARAIWAYSLAKKNTGTKTSMATPRTTFSTRNARIRNIWTCMSGDVVRSSTWAKTPRSTTPAAMLIPMAGFPHPQINDCWNPNTLNATPLEMRKRPR